MDKRLILIPAIFFGIIFIGTVGFQIMQPEYGFLDALYMTVTTVTTIGYGEIKPLSTGGRIFNLGLILLGWLGIFTVATMIARMIIEGEIIKFFGRRKMSKQLSVISGHYIVCGFGRVGRVVCDEFSRHNIQFVVVEREPDAVGLIKEMGLPFVEGDCTQDTVLLAAGIARAHGLINAVPDEADAVYITLSARQHNPDIFIMARADSPNAEKMLKRAGADRVISPQVAAGTRMAMAALRPSVVDFISIPTDRDEKGARVEEIEVMAGSRLVGKSFKDIDIRAKYGLNVLGVRKSDGSIIYNPTANYIIEIEDTLIMFGSEEQLSRVDELFVGARP
jgi:voltage-gated potassium channel